MRKYDLIKDPAAVPERVYALPELQYPPQVNAAAVIFETGRRNGCFGRRAYTAASVAVG